MSKVFRADINGLRGWAVLLVILFHFQIPGFQSGFIGVDVFFVISGYLMMGIILRGTNTGESFFSFLKKFYFDRAKRILPALAVLCFALIVFGYWWMSPSDYEYLGKHVVKALLFVSNHEYASEAGYFDRISHEKWLLHTWSLSVEWQFYLLFPVLVYWILRFAKTSSGLVFSLAFLTVASFLFSLLLTRISQVDAFFLLPSRAWQLLAGALIFFCQSRFSFSGSRALGMSVLGLGIIVATAVSPELDRVWPGWLALLPVAGACLLILANSNNLLTGNRLIQHLGNCSYSLYLWHWPLAVLLFQLELMDNQLSLILAVFFAWLLGYVSYRFVETPGRSLPARYGRKASLITLLVVVVFVMICARVVRVYDGLPQRLSPELQSVFAQANNRNPRWKECHVSGDKPVPECRYGGDQLGLIVLGDSHAASVIRAAERALPSKELHVLDWTLSGCRPIRGIQSVADPDFSCGEFLETVLSKSKQLPEEVPLLIVSRLSYEFYGDPYKAPGEAPPRYVSDPYKAWGEAYQKEMAQGYFDLACALADDRPVYLVRPFPEHSVDIPLAMARRAMTGRSGRIGLKLESYHQRHELAWRIQDKAFESCSVNILDPLPFLCDSETCWGDKSGSPLYFDDDHLNEQGASLLEPMFEHIFK